MTEAPRHGRILVDAPSEEQAFSALERVLGARQGRAAWMEARATVRLSGDDVRGTPVEWAFCAHAVDQAAPFVVEDAMRHPLVARNPLVVHEGIRCYAGVRLVTSGGHALSTLCVIGTEPRAFDETALAALRALAARVVAHLEARRVPAAP